MIIDICEYDWIKLRNVERYACLYLDNIWP